MISFLINIKIKMEKKGEEEKKEKLFTDEELEKYKKEMEEIKEEIKNSGID